MSAPTDRRWRDARGTRRASVEFGGKSPGRKPREKRRGKGARGHRTVWQRQVDRSRTLVRFGRKHKAGLWGWAGIVGALTCMWAFTGLAQSVTVVGSLAIGSGLAFANHRRRNNVVNGPNSRRASTAEVRAHHDAMLRTGRPAQPESGGTQRVRAHTNDGKDVGSYTRKKAA